jgi:hypothetical protein
MSQEQCIVRIVQRLILGELPGSQEWAIYHGQVQDSLRYINDPNRKINIY